MLREHTPTRATVRCRVTKLYSPDTPKSEYAPGPRKRFNAQAITIPSQSMRHLTRHDRSIGYNCFRMNALKKKKTRKLENCQRAVSRSRANSRTVPCASTAMAH